MARSQYIYIVLDDNRDIMAAFTVKHEMFTWAEYHKLSGLNYIRVSDGQTARLDVFPLKR